MLKQLKLNICKNKQIKVFSMKLLLNKKTKNKKLKNKN